VKCFSPFVIKLAFKKKQILTLLADAKFSSKFSLSINMKCDWKGLCCPLPQLLHTGNFLFLFLFSRFYCFQKRQKRDGVAPKYHGTKGFLFPSLWHSGKLLSIYSLGLKALGEHKDTRADTIVLTKCQWAGSFC